MANFKPQVSYETKESLNNYYNSSQYSKPKIKRGITKHFKTYSELLKNIKGFCEENIDEDGVFVVRSRRGQWGEWCERWKLVNGKPTIVKEGWS